MFLMTSSGQQSLVIVIDCTTDNGVYVICGRKFKDWTSVPNEGKKRILGRGGIFRGVWKE